MKYLFLVLAVSFSWNAKASSDQLASSDRFKVLEIPTDFTNHVEYEDQKTGAIPGKLWQGKLHRICATQDHSSADAFCKDKGYMKGVAKSADNLNLSGDTAACVDLSTKVTCQNNNCKGYHRISCLKDSSTKESTSDDYCSRYADASVHLGRAIRSSKKCSLKASDKWAGENGPHKAWCLAKKVSEVKQEMINKYELAKECAE